MRRSRRELIRKKWEFKWSIGVEGASRFAKKHEKNSLWQHRWAMTEKKSLQSHEIKGNQIISTETNEFHRKPMTAESFSHEKSEGIFLFCECVRPVPITSRVPEIGRNLK
jgi:hypothetical protein